MNNNTYILVCLSKPGTTNNTDSGHFQSSRYKVQVFAKTKMCNKFPVREDSHSSNRLTVGHDRVFVSKWSVIDVYELNGTHVYSFGKGTLSNVKDIAAGSDGQIFLLDHKYTKNEKIAHVFTEDGHQQNNFRVDSKEDDYYCLASYPSGEHLVFSGFERTTRRPKVAMYRKDGVLNRSVTLGERRFSKRDLFLTEHFSGIAVTNDGSVAFSFGSQEQQEKVIVRPMKPC